MGRTGGKRVSRVQPAAFDIGSCQLLRRPRTEGGMCARKGMEAGDERMKETAASLGEICDRAKTPNWINVFLLHVHLPS